MRPTASIPSVAARLFWLGFLPGALIGLVDAVQTIVGQPHVFGTFRAVALGVATVRAAAFYGLSLGLVIALLGLAWRATAGRYGPFGEWRVLRYLGGATLVALVVFGVSFWLGDRSPFSLTGVFTRRGLVLGLASRLAVCWGVGLVICLPLLFLRGRFATGSGRRSWRAAAITALVALALAVVDLGPRNGGGKHAGPNLVLIVVDALRADRLGCYGHSRPTSPHLDALCREALVFDRAVVQFPATGPSFGSLFTGKYPRRHGLSAMDPRSWLGGQFNRTLAEVLSEHGYATAAMMTGSLTRSSGLARGFNEVLEEMPAYGLYDVRSPWQALRSRSRLGRTAFRARQSVAYHPVVDEALAWIDRARRPYFVFVHLYDTHAPYDPPARHIEALDPGYHGPYRTLPAATLRRVRHGDLELDADAVRRLHNLYDAEVRTADESIGRIVDHLRRRGEIDDTILVVTADHGEELYDHGLVEHGYIYNTNLRVPLLVRLPGPAAARRFEAPFELIDLMPSLLEHLGVPVPEGIDGRALHLASPSATEPGIGSYAFSEADCAAGRGRGARDCWISVQNARWKLNLDVDTGSRQLFDLAADPYEQQDVAAAHPAVATRLLGRLQRWNQAQPDLEGLRQELDGAAREEVEKRLRSLGYIE